MGYVELERRRELNLTIHALEFIEGMTVCSIRGALLPEVQGSCLIPAGLQLRAVCWRTETAVHPVDRRLSREWTSSAAALKSSERRSYPESARAARSELSYRDCSRTSRCPRCVTVIVAIRESVTDDSRHNLRKPSRCWLPEAPRDRGPALIRTGRPIHGWLSRY